MASVYDSGVMNCYDCRAFVGKNEYRNSPFPESILRETCADHSFQNFSDEEEESLRQHQLHQQHQQQLLANIDDQVGHTLLHISG